MNLTSSFSNVQNVTAYNYSHKQRHTINDSIRGPIASAWNLTGGKFTFDVTIPVNTTATIYIPNPASSPVLESGKSITASEGLKLQGQQGQYTVLEAGSGTYHFSVVGDAAIAQLVGVGMG